MQKIDKKKEAGTNSSLSIIFELSSKTQWLSGLYHADPISFTAPTNCVEMGRRNRILTNDRFLVPLSLIPFFLSLSSVTDALILWNFSMPKVHFFWF